MKFGIPMIYKPGHLYEPIIRFKNLPHLSIRKDNYVKWLQDSVETIVAAKNWKPPEMK